VNTAPEFKINKRVSKEFIQAKKARAFALGKLELIVRTKKFARDKHTSFFCSSGFHLTYFVDIFFKKE
jgi:hypothetical protein